MRARVDRLQRQRVIEVDVGDHRDRRALHDRLQRDGVLLARYGDAHELAAGVRHAADLRERRLDVAGVGLRHRLYDDRRPPADRYVLHPDLPLRGYALMLEAWRRATGGAAPQRRLSVITFVVFVRAALPAREE